MGSCQPIQGLRLDTRSRETIKQIKQKIGSGNSIAVVTSIGVISSIFTKSNTLNAAYNISQTDWGVYAESLIAVPDITKSYIRKDMERMIIYYQLHYDDKLLRFWTGLHDGCRFI